MFSPSLKLCDCKRTKTTVFRSFSSNCGRGTVTQVTSARKHTDDKQPRPACGHSLTPPHQPPPHGFLRSFLRSAMPTFSASLRRPAVCKDSAPPTPRVSFRRRAIPVEGSVRKIITQNPDPVKHGVLRIDVSCSRVLHTVCSVEKGCGVFFLPGGLREKFRGTWHKRRGWGPSQWCLGCNLHTDNTVLQFSHHIFRLYFDCQVFSSLRSSASCCCSFPFSFLFFFHRQRLLLVSRPHPV